MNTVLEIFDKAVNAVIALVIILSLLFSFWSLYDVYNIYANAGSSLTFGNAQRDISLPEYMEINPDVIAFLDIEDTGIHYPVLQGEDNTEYLNKDVYGEYRMSGSIYIDCNNSPDFTDSYTLFYGHRMKASAMFGDIGNFLDEQYFNEHQFGTLSLPDRCLKITFFACMKTQATNSFVFNVCNANENLSAVISDIQKEGVCYKEINFTEKSKIVAFSTCETATSFGRIILFGVLED